MSTVPVPPPEPTVVGIGASAGGLTALKIFLDHVPPDSGLAFVVVVHLSPNHESHLAELLQPHGRIPVTQVMETVTLRPNHVYVIPPNANLSTIDTHLRLSKLEERRQDRAPIDHFFRTLAATHDGRAIAVVLTGTGSHGTLGVKEIKAHGGLVIVQDPKEAEFDGMPQSAIATGLVDLILPLAEIPGNILRYTRTQPRGPLPNLSAGHSNGVIKNPDPIAYGNLHRQMVEQYAPPSILIGPDDKIVHFSEHAARYLKHPDGKPTSSAATLVREELRIELQTSLQAARDKKEAFDSLPVPVHFDGVSRPVVLHVRPARESERNGFVLIIFEEREPRALNQPSPSSEEGNAARIAELESELRTTRQRLQRVANVAGVGVLIFEKSGTIVDCNDAFLALSGYSRAEVSAKMLNWRNVTAEEYLPETERQFQLLAETGGINFYEKEIILKNGSHRWMIVASVSLGDGTSAEYCFDVADRKKAEDLVRKGDEHLRKANRELLRSNSDLKHFSYAVSHDMLEPLRMVMSYTQLLARDFVSQDSKAQTYIHYAVDGAKQMQSMLTGLREYWSVEHEEPEELGQCAMEAIFQHTLEHLREVIQSAGGVITHDPLPTVMGQEYPLQLLFQNLIQNALKYRRPDTPPRIHASAERDGRMFTFSIADNGIGIDPAETEVIFAPFKRLHPTKYPGTGLGLAMCQKVVERHLGRIWVESIPGKGSTFYFTLPAAPRG